MAALVCDICGGKLSMGSGGIAVCESCGMEHAKDRVQEKIREIKGTVRIDNSHMVENYFNIAQTAYDTNNLAEAEAYCNKAIELDPSVSQVWILKAKVIGMGSSWLKSKLTEALAIISSLIPKVAKEDQESVINACIAMVESLIIHEVNLYNIEFDTDGKPQGSSYFTYGQEYLPSMIKSIGEFLTKWEGLGIDKSKLTHTVASCIREFVWKYCVKYYFHNFVNRVAKENFTSPYTISVESYEFKNEYLKPIEQSIELLDATIRILDDNDWEDKLRILGDEEYLLGTGIQQCRVFVGEKYLMKLKPHPSLMDVIESSPETAELSKVSLIQGENDTKEISQKAKTFIKLHEEKCEKIKKEFTNIYWEKHSEEKESLEVLSQELNLQNKPLVDEIRKLQASKEISGFEKQAQQLTQEKRSLGLLKRREKNAIQKEIDLITDKLDKLKNERDASIQKLKTQQRHIEEQLRQIQITLGGPKISNSRDSGLRYKLGDIGPGGGYVFYDKGWSNNGWQYLEAAPAGWSGTSEDPKYCFGDYQIESANISVGTVTAIGAGALNTIDLMKAMGDTTYSSFGGNDSKKEAYAAKICSDYKGGGYNDWFLPSRDELDVMYKQLRDIDPRGTYWSSSMYSLKDVFEDEEYEDEIFLDRVWGQDFGNGDKDNIALYKPCKIRPIRAF